MLKKKLLWTAKNMMGAHTSRKLVAFSVDDYGSQRIASAVARENMRAAGMNVHQNRFDCYDTFDTAQDFVELYKVLSSVRDGNGRPAVFTPYALSANIDFARMEEEGYKEYRYELAKDMCARLGGDYAAVPDLWREGIERGLWVPQFHGREHLNLKCLMTRLAEKDAQTLTCFENRSYGAFSTRFSPNISYVSAFQFDDFSENTLLAEVITDGLNAFEKNYGYRATVFTPPGGREHHVLHRTLAEGGIKYIDVMNMALEHQGGGVHKRQYYLTSRPNEYGQHTITRNCVYEPMLPTPVNNITYVLMQIENAFMCRKPANISTHRVNFCGGIDPANRQRGLAHLGQLLKAIVTRWPDVEFVTTEEMSNIVYPSK